MLFNPYAYDLAHPAPPPPSVNPALAEETLLAVPTEAQHVLWHGLMDAVDGALDLWERTPPGHRAPSPFTVLHAGKLHSDPAVLRQQTLAGWHRLVGIELRLAAQIIEALLTAEDAAVYWTLLAEQCARVGQLYSELKRRAGADVALMLLRWELRMLRYRASPVLAPLIYN